MLKINKWAYLGILFILLILFWYFGSKSITQPASIQKSISVVTDKSEYLQGDIITITVNNTLEVPAYFGEIDRFWQIEVKGTNWTDIEKMHAFWLIDRRMGDDKDCRIPFYDYDDPHILNPNSSIQTTWNQKMCLLEDLSNSETSDNVTPVLLEKGTYRFVFRYGLNIEGKPGQMRILDKNFAYSDEFTIR